MSTAFLKIFWEVTFPRLSSHWQEASGCDHCTPEQLDPLRSGEQPGLQNGITPNQSRLAILAKKILAKRQVISSQKNTAVKRAGFLKRGAVQVYIAESRCVDFYIGVLSPVELASRS